VPCAWRSRKMPYFMEQVIEPGEKLIFRNVQALRAAAALLVVTVHLANSTGFEARYLSPTPTVMKLFGTAGFYGVDLFFVISGFIMTVTTWTLFGNAANSLTFVLRRITRIYPPYWTVLLPILLVYLVRPDLVDSHAGTHPNVFASFLLLPQLGEPLLLVSWSLVFEMAFYAVFAFALCFRRPLLPVILIAWTLGIASASAHWANSHNPYLRFLANPLPIEFFFGIGVGALVMSGNVKRPAIALAIGVALVAILVTLGTLHDDSDYPNLWWRALMGGCGFACLLYGVVVLEKDRGVTFPRWLNALGDASYAMYLWHIPVLTVLGLIVVRLHARSLSAHIVLLAIAFGSVIAVALFIFRYIEQPQTRALHRRLSLR